MNEFITDERYIPLRLLSNAYGRMEFTKLMSGMLPFCHDGMPPKEVLRAMLAQDLISCTFKPYSDVILLDSGRTLLQELDNSASQLRQNAKQKKLDEERQDRIIKEEQAARRADIKLEYKMSFRNMFLTALLSGLFANLFDIAKFLVDIVKFVTSYFQ